MLMGGVDVEVKKLAVEDFLIGPSFHMQASIKPLNRPMSMKQP
jgi:hypothetical protein